MTFGEKIQKLRKEAGLSQEELAHRLKVSRQAVSKWERDSGYPETEKIIWMSSIFNVSADYLLKDEATDVRNRSVGDQGLFVNMKAAEGFMACQKIRKAKTGAGIGACIGSLAFSFMEPEIGVILTMLFIIGGIVLLFSAKLGDDPYAPMRSERLILDSDVRKRLAEDYERNGKRAHRGMLAGIAMIAVGILLVPLMIPAELSVLDDVIMGLGMIIAGAGAFLCIYMWGVIKAYRILLGGTGHWKGGVGK